MSSQSDTPTRATVKRERADGLFVRKLTDDVIQTIAEEIEAMSSAEAAATLAGVHVSTYRKWLAEGRAWNENATEGEIPIPEAVFAARIDRALAVQRQKAEKRVGGSEDWRAAAFMLERRFQKDWGKRERVDIGNPDGEEFRLSGVDLSALSPEQLRSLREIWRVLADAERGADVIDMPRRQRELGTGT